MSRLRDRRRARRDMQRLEQVPAFACCARCFRLELELDHEGHCATCHRAIDCEGEVTS